MLQLLSHLIRRSTPWTLMVLCLGLAGCASWDARPETKTADSDASFGAELRKPTPPGQMQGIDARAREIERNLGVR